MSRLDKENARAAVVRERDELRRELAGWMLHAGELAEALRWTLAHHRAALGSVAHSAVHSMANAEAVLKRHAERIGRAER